MSTSQPFNSPLTAEQRLSAAQKLLEHLNQMYPSSQDVEIGDVLLMAALAKLGPGGIRHWLKCHF